MKMFVETNAGAGVLVGVGSPANSPQAKTTGKTSSIKRKLPYGARWSFDNAGGTHVWSSLKLRRLSPSIDRHKGFASTGDCTVGRRSPVEDSSILAQRYPACGSVQAVVL